MQKDQNKTALKAGNKLHEAPLPPELLISRKNRIFIIVASLLALFLGALDALVMGAAMPSIVAHLGGLHLYSWAFSAYLLSRAVALPVFGKLCDLYSSKKLFNVSIGIFLAGSVFAGISHNMTQLILSRVIQGIGAGGNFALTYIVLSDISSPENRGKMMSIATLLLVQNSVDISNLGIVTASHQFTRTLGGTIGIGISGSLVTAKFLNALEKVMSFDLRQKIDPELFFKIQQNVENIFRPEIQTLLSADVQQALQSAVGHGVMPMFWASLLSSIVCLVFSIMLPRSD